MDVAAPRCSAAPAPRSSELLPLPLQPGPGRERGEGGMRQGGEKRERRNRKRLWGEAGVCCNPYNPGSAQVFQPESRFLPRIRSVLESEVFQSPQDPALVLLVPLVLFPGSRQSGRAGLCPWPLCQGSRCPHPAEGQPSGPVTHSSVPSPRLALVWDLQSHQQFAVGIPNPRQERLSFCPTLRRTGTLPGCTLGTDPWLKPLSSPIPKLLPGSHGNYGIPSTPCRAS